MKPTYAKNEKVEFKDMDGVFHAGYVKKSPRRGLLRRTWWYDICESGRVSDGRKVYVVPERNIFGLVPQKDNGVKQPNIE